MIKDRRAHADNQSDDPRKRCLDRLLEMLRPLTRQAHFSIWSDQEIKAGENWHERIKTQMVQAKAVVLLVSPAFLASDYIATNELPVLLKQCRHVYGKRTSNPNRKVISRAVPAIVTEQTWLAAKEVLQSNRIICKRNTHAVYLLRG